MIGSKTVPIWTLAFSLILLLGCSGNQKPLAKVSGYVELEGRPVAGARLVFQPVKEGGSASFGETDEKGFYELGYSADVLGAEIGKHRVQISTDFIRTMPDGTQEQIAELIPAEFNVEGGVEKEVVAGNNQISFEINPSTN